MTVPRALQARLSTFWLSVAILLAAAAFAVLALVRPRTGHQPIAGGDFEASGVVHLANQAGVMFVDDNDATHAYWLPLTGDGTQRGLPLRVALGLEVVDPEGITSDGRYIYIVGSQSKPGAPPGVGLVRFTFDATQQTVGDVASISGLKSVMAAAVPALRAFDPAIGDDAFNIEGLAWDARASRLLIGLRAPVIDGDALIVGARLRDPQAGFTAANLEVAEAARLPLDGAGIRSVEYDPARARFLIISGASPNEEALDFRLLEWDADGPAAIREVRRYPAGLKPEGLTRAALAESNPLFLVFDTGRYEAIR